MSPTNTFTYPQKGEDQKKKKKAVFIKNSWDSQEKWSTIADCFSRLASVALELWTPSDWSKDGLMKFSIHGANSSSLVFTFRGQWICFGGHWICVLDWHFMVMFSLICGDKSSWIIWCSFHMFAHIALETSTSIITSARQIKWCLKGLFYWKKYSSMVVKTWIL